MATPKQRASARTNGHFGGAPSKELVELRRKSRDRATRIVASKQEEAVLFLVYVMNNPNASVSERVRCAIELLDRGELPKKSASYLGVGGIEEMDAVFGSPKLVVLGKYGSEKNGHANGSAAVVIETSEVNGHGVDDSTSDAGDTQ